MSVVINHLNPEELGKPLGLYSHISRARTSEVIFIAGQVAVNLQGEIVGKGNFEAQTRQVFENIDSALRSVGCGFSNIAKFTTYLVNSQDIERFMSIRRSLFPNLFPRGAYPPNTLLVVDRLVQEHLLVEIETVVLL
jgi:enamine deaminase RidA (YjgF/YER057c/UK114 family)